MPSDIPAPEPIFREKLVAEPAAEAPSARGKPANAGIPAPALTPPPYVPLPAWKTPFYFFASVLFSITQGLGMNLALANLTQIQGSIAATTTESAWLSAAYMAPNVSLAIALVKVRMQYGVRKLAQVSVAIFILASVLNLFISDLQSAIVVRFLSGIAAAPLATLGFLYMLELFPPEKRGTVALGLVIMDTLLGAPLTRLVSPTLIDFGGWRGLYTLEMSLALLVLPVIYLLPLTIPPRVKVIVRADIVSYLLIAIGFGCLAVALSVGRAYWWFDVPWLGVVLAVAVASLCLAGFIELRRKTPLIDIHWLLTWKNIHLLGILFLFRIMLGEQSATVTMYYQNIGLLFEQLQTLYWLILIFTLLGGFTCAAMMNRGYGVGLQAVGLVMMASGSFIDANLTNLVRPDQMYLSQALVSMGAALFVPPSLGVLFNAAFVKGPPYVVTFFVLFMFSQVIGSLAATAFFGTFITVREKFHSNLLVENIHLTNPVVVDRVSKLVAPYSKLIGDGALLNGEGLTLLGAQVTREANILAFSDSFFLAGTLAVGALGLMLLHLLALAVVAKFAKPALQPQ